jgi:hypothetical protein
MGVERKAAEDARDFHSGDIVCLIDEHSGEIVMKTFFI